MRKPLLMALAGAWSLGTAATASAQPVNPVKFNARPPYEVAKSPEFLAVADMNSDGIPDVIASSPTSQKVTVLTGGSEGFAAVVAAGPFLTTRFSKPEQVAAGDLNGDGFTDVAFADSLANQLVVLIGNNDGSLGNPVFIQTGAKPWGVAIGQFGNTSCNDIAVTNQTDNNVSVFFNRCSGNGRASFSPPTSFPTSKKPGLLFADDFNNDLIPDLVDINIGNIGANDMTELLGTGGNFQNHGNFVVGDGAQQATTFDFDNDGNVDIAVASGRITSRHVFSSSFTVLLGDGSGFFGRSNNFQVDCTQLIPDTAVCLPIGIAAGDFNLDGIPDLAVAVAYANKLLIYAGNGDGTFDLIGQPIDIVGNPTFMVAADFDDDGRVDLAIAERADATSGGVIRLFLNNTDFPVPATATPTPTGPIVPPQATATGSVRPPVTPSKQNGDLCGGADECFSGFCEQGRCCNRACNGVTEACNQNPNPGVCLPKFTPIPSPTTGGTGSTFIGRSSGCSTNDGGGSPWGPLAVVFVPAALWLGRRWNASPARVPIRTRTR